jgi:cytidine deaminase
MILGVDNMNIWEEMYELAKKEYHPEDVSPFIYAHHVVAAVQSKSGKIYTGFCIEGASGVINLCAERVAALKMYMDSGETVIKRMIAFRSEPPKENGGMPCGACREFLMQLSEENKNIEILTDYETKKIVILKDLIPNWWGDKRYNNK